MAHQFRFFANRLAPQTWEVDDGETLHINRVLRLPDQSEIEVFDGTGWLAKALIQRHSKNHIELKVIKETQVPAKSPRILILGALKSSGLDEILAALCELGLDQIYLYRPEQSSLQLSDPKLRRRWKKILIAAAKQCKSPFLPQILVHDSLRNAVAACLKAHPGHRRYFWYERPEDANPTRAREFLLQNSDHLFCIGCESGFTQSEHLALLEQNFKPLHLPCHVLRSQTAAIAAAALLAFSAPPLPYGLDL